MLKIYICLNNANKFLSLNTSRVNQCKYLVSKIVLLEIFCPSDLSGFMGKTRRKLGWAGLSSVRTKYSLKTLQLRTKEFFCISEFWRTILQQTPSCMCSRVYQRLHYFQDDCRRWIIFYSATIQKIQGVKKMRLGFYFGALLDPIGVKTEHGYFLTIL